MPSNELVEQYRQLVEQYDVLRQRIDKALEQRGRFKESVLARVLEDYERQRVTLEDQLAPNEDLVFGLVAQCEQDRLRLEAQRAQLEEARDEVELRHLIGELGDHDFEVRLAELEQGVQQIGAQLASVDSTLTEYRDLLTRAGAEARRGQRPIVMPATSPVVPPAPAQPAAVPVVGTAPVPPTVPPFGTGLPSIPEPPRLLTAQTSYVPVVTAAPSKPEPVFAPPIVPPAVVSSPIVPSPIVPPPVVPSPALVPPVPSMPLAPPPVPTPSFVMEATGALPAPELAPLEPLPPMPSSEAWGSTAILPQNALRPVAPSSANPSYLGSAGMIPDARVSFPGTPMAGNLDATTFPPMDNLGFPAGGLADDLPPMPAPSVDDMGAGLNELDKGWGYQDDFPPPGGYLDPQGPGGMVDGDLGALGFPGGGDDLPPIGQAPQAVLTGYLIKNYGRPDQESYRLDDAVVQIGRGRDNQIQIKDDTKVSRYHCRILRDADGFYVEDNNSSNGTLVNGAPVNRQKVLGNEDVTIGETVFRFVLA